MYLRTLRSYVGAIRGELDLHRKRRRAAWPALGIALRGRTAPVAQLDRAPDFESGGQGFESLPARQQLIEAATISPLKVRLCFHAAPRWKQYGSRGKIIHIRTPRKRCSRVRGPGTSRPSCARSRLALRRRHHGTVPCVTGGA